MPTIYDNIDEHLENGLNKTLEYSQRADFCIGYFNLRGWKKIAKNISELPGDHLSEEYNDGKIYHCRLLIGMQRLPSDQIKNFYSLRNSAEIDTKKAAELKKKITEKFKDQLTFGNPTNSDERALQKLAKQLKEKKVIVQLHLRHQLHAKLYLAYRDDYNSPIIGFVGSSNLTLSGISKQGELNVDVVEGDSANKLSTWFQNRWDDRWSIDITEELAEIIDSSWATDKLYKPYYLYLKIAYHLSREARAGISEFKLPKIFKNKLLLYQKRAVKIAAHHLHQRGGTIIGDVVGLGKTITATALAKMFEHDFSLETLIICPKNLVKMWDAYVYKYHLNAKIIPITQVQTKLRDERRYRLMIIDESHNLRNRDGKRYRAIQEYIYLNDSRVIMLTATPYNKAYTDLSNQLKLFLDDSYNLGISPENYIKNIGGIEQFSANHQVPENSISAFEKSDFSEDWAELMRLFLVRRTRSFIKNNYAKEDEKTGKKYLEFPNGDKQYFPERIPKKVEYDFNSQDPNDQYAKMYSKKVVDLIDSLKLPRYGLGQKQYEINSYESLISAEEEKIRENLSRAGTRLIGFARTNLFKRLESSGHSFLLSISRHILRNYIFIHAINNGLPLPIGSQEAGIIDEYLYSDRDLEDDTDINIIYTKDEFLEQAEKLYKYLRTKENQYDWINSKLFNNKLEEALIEDSKKLMTILDLGKNWNQKDDKQLNALFDLINNKHSNEKILIFSQFSDTVEYLYESLKNRGIDKIERATGDSDDPTNIAYKFSPVSNEEDIDDKDQIRVLISTDVLSEGQNLQDAHIVLNYDLPWAIIRLIQRAGRVDRIGQKSSEILVYSFLPEDGIEDIINLRGRLRQRIRENAETVGSDEIFFEGDPININDLYNEKAGLLDDEDESEVDLASYAYQIWKNAIDSNPNLEKLIPDLPNVIYATKKAKESQELNGSIVYAKTSKENDILTWIDSEENIVTQSQFRILRAINCQPDEKALEKFDKHHKLVKIGLEHIREVEKKVGGQLGRKNGARYRVFNRLKSYSDKYYDLATDELKRAIQAIYDHPLRQYARDTLNRQLRAGIDDQVLSDLVVSLREDGKLSLINEKENLYKDPQIICSMGLKVN